MAGVRYESHDRVLPSRRVIRVATARRWTAEDYDIIEELIAQGLRYKEIATHFTDPPVSRIALERAIRAAGIEYHHKAGRPRKKADHGT